jgi:hypothetical protein
MGNVTRRILLEASAAATLTPAAVGAAEHRTAMHGARDAKSPPQTVLLPVSLVSADASPPASAASR